MRGTAIGLLKFLLYFWDVGFLVVSDFRGNDYVLKFAHDIKPLFAIVARTRMFVI